MKTILRVLIASVAIGLAPGLANAAPDFYPGDTAIYGGVPSALQPNVLIILDNSGSMTDSVPGSPYNSGTTYTSGNYCEKIVTASIGGDTLGGWALAQFGGGGGGGGGRGGGGGGGGRGGGGPVTVACEATKVYVSVCSGGGRGGGGGSCKWREHIGDVANVTTSCPAGTDPKNSLLSTGQWNSNNRELNTNGSCGASTSGQYATGNWVNWINTPGVLEPKMQIASRVVRNLLQSTTGVRIGMMNFRSDSEGGKLWTYNSYTTSVKDMDAIFSGTTTNRAALIAAVSDVEDDVLNDNNGTSTPLAETLFEAMRYYKSAASAFNAGVTYTSPIQEACQQNYVVIVTDGMSTNDRNNVLTSICVNGDCNADGHEVANDPAKVYNSNGSDYLDDVAWYLNHTDMSTGAGGFTGDQFVKTFTVGFGLNVGSTPAELAEEASGKKLLEEAGTLGGGDAFLANDESQLAAALTQIVGSIFETNSAFVAPVVPVSPENRTYSGSRVYLGFFKPQSGKAFWLGNLKKYGIDDDGAVVDKNGAVANYVDNDGNGIDDFLNDALENGASNGSFRSAATSYWSSTQDAGNVDSGGVGKVLADRDFSTDPRKIYTYTGTNTALTDSSNAFTTANAAVTAALLGVGTATDRTNVINYVHGYDAYDTDDGDGNTTEKREWILGDVLHSQPLVVSYQSYGVAKEATCDPTDPDANHTLIFVGANDGMLHAFRDCDGSEAWAFIPPDVLSNLQYLDNVTHTYFVDGSPTVYRYDADNDGKIETGDRVLLIFGERRGGGYYYALDVTDPNNPVYSWRLSATTSPSGTNTDYSELAQTWSDLKLAKIKVGSYVKMAAIIGAGYDNFNEDGRYGSTTGYPQVAPSGSGAGNVTSFSAGSALSPKGRGVYVIEIARISDATGNPIAPDLTNSGWKIWGYRYADDSNLRYSFPSAVAPVDTDYNGLIDRFYVGDAGARMWAFDIKSTSTASWTARWLFSAFDVNTPAGNQGRKIFYPPSPVFEVGYVNLAFGTGDREHPLNTAVADRLYSLKDKGQTTPIRETNTDELVDVTADLLQVSTNQTVINDLLQDLKDQYGWYIRLETGGEKVLAPALTFGFSYYATYTPISSGDPCEVDALGIGRLYVVNYRTGEAVQNFDSTNDAGAASYTNSRAKVGAGGQAQGGGWAGAGGGGGSDPADLKLLLKDDRFESLGSGIPSGVVPIIPPDGQIELLAGAGGTLQQPPPPDLDPTTSLYWRRVF